MNRNLIFFNAEITPIRKLLLMHLAAGGKLTEYTVTGNPVTFDTNVAKPLSECMLSFLPVQSGTGDPSPDNVRPVTGWTGAEAWHSGANLIDDTKRYQSSSTMLYIGATNNERNLFFKAGKYTVTRDFNGETIGVYYVKRGSSSEKTIFNGTATETTKTITIAEDGYYAVFCYRASASGGVDTSDIKHLMIEHGETATPFEEYSGSSVSVTFPAQGKNLLDITQTAEVKPGVSGSTITIADGVISIDAIAGSARTYVIFSQKFPAGTYTIQAKPSGACSSARLISSVEFEGSSYNSYYGGYIKAIGTSIGYLTFTLSSAAYIGLNLANASGEAGSPGSVYDIQLESGTSATAYEAFDNTAYGGTLDLTTGVLTVEWAGVTEKWSNFDGKTDLGDNVRGYVSLTGKKSISGDSREMCNLAKRSYNYSSDSVHFYTNGSSAFMFLPENTDGDTEVQIIYPLATPLVYQLTPQEIQTLIGTNVLWSDTNGDMEVKYLKKG